MVDKNKDKNTIIHNIAAEPTLSMEMALQFSHISSAY